MKVNFLAADVRLSKTFEEIAPGQYRETTYPHVRDFTSIERDIGMSLNLFHDYLLACADEGLCLLKGQLDRSLVGESRAGHTNSAEPTQYVVLDVDTPVTGLSQAEFLDALGPEFEGVSFIFHYSASHGIKHHEGWRGHFFLLLASPTPPQVLKEWLVSLNLTRSYLEERLSLSACGGALRYPLDITTCQNDKLIFIAPPTCKGFDDPVESRFEFFLREKDVLTPNLLKVSATKNKQMKDNVLRNLRQAEGREIKKFKTTNYHGHEVITNPDPVIVTGKKEERGFVYLNLNGGDSWGYFFPGDNPEVLYNFKDEPCMFMRDVDKEIYREHTEIQKPVEGAIPFGFLWPDNDCYYRGFANPNTGEVDWVKPVGSKAKLKDFYTQNGVPLPSGWAVDEWQMEFDPSREGCADFRAQCINTYRQSEYIRNARRVTTPSIPPTIDKVLSSVCVDDETKDHFLNWLACIFQTRVKTGTAWIFQGVQGTGKGVLFSHIIAPLIGRQYCHEMTMDRLSDDFNEYLSENIILFIDEAEISDSSHGDKLLDRVKNLVTESTQHVRAMRRNAVLRENYTNVILASNHNEIIPLDPTDRRFNVAPRQEVPIQLGYEDIDRIATELRDFADTLHSYNVDMVSTRRVLENTSRQTLIELSQTTVEKFFAAIRNQELEYFAQFLDPNSGPENLQYYEYEKVVSKWIKASQQGEAVVIPRMDLEKVYNYLQSTKVTPTKFSRMANLHGTKIGPVRDGDEVFRGIQQYWPPLKEEITVNERENSNVVTLSRGTRSD